MKDIRLTKLLLDVSYNMISDVVVNIDDGNPLTKNDYDKIYCVRDCITELLKIYRDKPKKNIPTFKDNSNENDCRISSDVICPKCGSIMNKQEGLVLTSNPPQYVYICSICGSKVTKTESQITNHPQIYNNCYITSEPTKLIEPTVGLSEALMDTKKVSMSSIYGEMNKKLMYMNEDNAKSISSEERND